MARAPGQNPGHSPEGWGWGDLVATLVETHGSLTAVAWKLVDGTDLDVASAERALRRLRMRGRLDGGTWGARVLRTFGVPRAVEERLRFMGLYHSPFVELPLHMCEDQLQLWDRPPVSASPARVWLQLAAVNVALRRRDFAHAKAMLDAATSKDPAARVEIALARAYVESRVGTEHVAMTEEAARVLESADIRGDDRVCFAARVADHRAFELNRRADHARALALYRALSTDDVHPFASYRREAGLAYGCLHTGEREAAVAHARAALDHAGDGGYPRLRAMALLMLARVTNDTAYVRRAAAIADRLDDGELRRRVERFTMTRSPR